jgi:hypothetical protein
MKNVTRRLGTMLLFGGLGSLLMGCSNADDGRGTNDAVGQLALPLVTQGASGITYRLREATFAISRYGYYEGAPVGTGGATASAGTGSGGSAGGEVILVSSEDDPDATSISVSLEEGGYYVQLLPGWHFEKESPTGTEAVEATLLSGEAQWVWVSRQSTSFAEFQFGLGDRELWLNGQLNIGVRLYEDPSEIGGYGGYGGYGGSPGGSAGAAGGGGLWGTAGTAVGGTSSIP